MIDYEFIGTTNYASFTTGSDHCTRDATTAMLLNEHIGRFLEKDERVEEPSDCHYAPITCRTTRHSSLSRGVKQRCQNKVR